MNEKTTGFQDKLMKYMMPVANWVEKNNWLQAIKDGMIADIPVIIIGSIFLLPIALNNLIASGPIHDFISAHMGVLTYAAGFTNDLLSIFAAFFIAVALAKRYGIHNTQTGVTAIIVHLILSAVSIDGGISTEFLGGVGSLYQYCFRYFECGNHTVPDQEECDYQAAILRTSDGRRELRLPDPSGSQRYCGGCHRQHLDCGFRTGIPGGHYEAAGTCDQHYGHASGSADCNLPDTIFMVLWSSRTFHHLRGVGCICNCLSG